MTITIRSMFDIGADLERIHAELTDSGGELTPDLETRLTSLTDELGAKVDGYGYKLRGLQMKIAGHKERIEFHQAQVRAYERIEEYLKQALVQTLIRLGAKKLSGEDFSATLGESQRAIVDDPSKLPAEFWVQKLPEIHTAAVRKALLDGVDVPGARLEPHQYVRVR